MKRVPATEAQGRIHTSTATVATLAEPEEVDIKIDWINDVEEFATRSPRAPGGQNVNKVETAWQIHHKPSGMPDHQDDGGQEPAAKLANAPRRLLVARLYEAERHHRQHADRAATRKTQIGSGDRSEKIRTYRWKDGIVADERCRASTPCGTSWRGTCRSSSRTCWSRKRPSGSRNCEF